MVDGTLSLLQPKDEDRKVDLSKVPGKDHEGQVG